MRHWCNQGLICAVGVLYFLLGICGALNPMQWLCSVPSKGICSRFLAVCRATSCRCASSRFFICLWFLCILRVGEALNPGPCSETQFCLGSFNPSGLNHKAQYVSTHLNFGDVWAVSETHLTIRGMQSFRKSLQFHSSKFKYCYGGHPVSQFGTNGSWKGVAILSAHPTRVLPQSWLQKLPILPGSCSQLR